MEKDKLKAPHTIRVPWYVWEMVVQDCSKTFTSPSKFIVDSAIQRCGGTRRLEKLYDSINKLAVSTPTAESDAPEGMSGENNDF